MEGVEVVGTAVEGVVAGDSLGLAGGREDGFTSVAVLIGAGRRSWSEVGRPIVGLLITAGFLVLDLAVGRLRRS